MATQTMMCAAWDSSNSHCLLTQPLKVKEGTKLELPLWLAEMLAVSQPQSGASTLTLDMPPALSVRVMNALKADPKTLDLRALAPHFYALGSRMLELFEEDEVGEVLNDVCLLHYSVALITRLTRVDIQEESQRDCRPSSQSAWCTRRGCGVPQRT
jgi:hypothetical protein